MAGHRLLLEARDLAVCEPGEVVESLVVFAHVIEAEAEILAFAHAADRSAMGAGLLAAVPLAARRARPHAPPRGPGARGSSRNISNKASSRCRLWDASRRETRIDIWLLMHLTADLRIRSPSIPGMCGGRSTYGARRRGCPYSKRSKPSSWPPLRPSGWTSSTKATSTPAIIMRPRATIGVRRHRRNPFSGPHRVSGLCGQEPDRASPGGQRGLSAELAGAVHALAIEPAAPGEATRW